MPVATARRTADYFASPRRDPANPRAMLARYDSGDTLHPNSAGYAAMAGSINLMLFKGTKIFG